MVTLAELQNCKNILMVNHHLAMGDAVLLSPIFKVLKDNLPEASLSVLTRSYAQDFLLSIPHIDNIIDIETILKPPVDNRFYGSKIAALARLAFFFKKQRYDCIILRNDKRVMHTRKLYFAARLCGARIVAINAYLQKHVKESQHIVETYYSILEDIGMRIVEKERLYITLSADSVKGAEKHLSDKGTKSNSHRIVGICPTSNLMVKNWSFKKVGKLCEEIGDSAKIIIFSLHNDAYRDITKFTRHTPIFIERMGFKDLLGFISRCDVFVGVDTGPTHIAAALGLPTIGLYGPTSGSIAGPYGKACLFIQAKVDCPNYKPLSLFSPFESLQDCYINDKCTRFDTTCVDTIDPIEVAEKVKSLVNANVIKKRGLHR